VSVALASLLLFAPYLQWGNTGWAKKLKNRTVELNSFLFF
jgi:hypothetical protein